MQIAEQLTNALRDRYRIEREIGRGGMATVYLARDVRHDRLVALKVLNPELGAVLGVDRFLAEIRVTAHLQHPNLLPLFDSGEANGLLFYVMPFVEGESLRSWLDREKQLPIADAVHVAISVAGALEYAHAHGVVHRDLKPENILIQAGEPLVADFGIALAVSNAGGARVTQTGISLGTPQYMSPEQATGDRSIDRRSDVYSLVAVLYEMLVGDPPHTGSTAQAIIAKVLTDKPRAVWTTSRSDCADGELRIVDIDGRATPSSLAKVGSPLGGSWATNGLILFAGDPGVIYRVRPGEDPVAVTKRGAEVQHMRPRFLHDGRHFLFSTTRGVLFVGDVRDGSQRRLALGGAATFQKVPTNRIRVWLDRHGAPIDSIGRDSAWTYRLSHDGNLVAQGGFVLSVRDLRRNVTLQLPTGPGGFVSTWPVWAPDDSRLAFFEADAIYGRMKVVRADGTAEPVVLGEGLSPVDWTSDGRSVLASGRVSTSNPARALWLIDIDSQKSLEKPWLSVSGNIQAARLSPNGRWLAYQSDETGVPEVYVRPFPGSGPPVRISPAGGGVPVWRADGRELYYLTPAGDLAAVSVTTGAKFDAGTPQLLFRGVTRLPYSPFVTPYDVSPDGQRFLVYTENRTATPLTVLAPWQRLLTRR